MSDQTKKTTEDWVPVAPPIPDHWSYVDFDEAFDAMSTNGIKIPEAQYSATGRFPIVDQGKNFVGGYTDAESNVVNQDGTVIVFGDHTRCFKLINFPFAPGADGTKVLSPAPYLAPKFAYYGCLSLKLPDRGYSRHYSFLRRSKFPIAPLKEQDRIIAKIEELFSELDKGVESLTTAREQLKAYRQSVLKSAFEGKMTENWRAESADKLEPGTILLGHIEQERERQYGDDLAEWREAVRAAEISGHDKPRKPSKPTVPDKPSPQQISLMGSLPPSWTWAQLGNFAFVTKLAGFEYTKFVKYDDAGDLEVIKAENAGPNGFRETEFSKIRSDTVATLARSRLNGGELLMVFVGAGTGNVATVPQGRSFFLGPNIGMMRITSDRVNPYYVEHFLRSPHGRELVLSSVKAVAQPSLSMGTIRQIPVALPSLEEQSEIVRILESKLEAADVMDAEIDAGLARAEALRQSILKRAFSGQLVTQDAADEPASVVLERIRAEREENGTSKRRNIKNNKKEAA